MKRLLSAASLIFVFLCAGAMAYALSPTQTIQHIGDGMISALQAHQAQLQDRAVIRKIVNKELVPYVDLTSMAGRVVGRKAWMHATPKSRREFEDRFKHVLINTYSAALASYDRDKVHVYPLRAKPTQLAQVKSDIVRRNGQRILMVYNMRKEPEGWRIYDVSIENVSIVDNYRAQYASVLQQGGLALLNARLAKH